MSVIQCQWLSQLAGAHRLHSKQYRHTDFRRDDFLHTFTTNCASHQIAKQPCLNKTGLSSLCKQIVLRRFQFSHPIRLRRLTNYQAHIIHSLKLALNKWRALIVAWLFSGIKISNKQLLLVQIELLSMSLIPCTSLATKRKTALLIGNDKTQHLSTAKAIFICRFQLFEKTTVPSGQMNNKE